MKTTTISNSNSTVRLTVSLTCDKKVNINVETGDLGDPDSWSDITLEREDLTELMRTLEEYKAHATGIPNSIDSDGSFR